MTAELTARDLVLVRSDTGDGGWSLHTKAEVADAEAHSDAPAILVSGDAYNVADTRDGWSRPNAYDYAEALRIANAALKE